MMAFGVISLQENITFYEELEVTLIFARKAAQLEFGVQQGANVSGMQAERLYQRGPARNEIPYQLTDSPEDNNAVCLFGADGVAHYQKIDGKQIRLDKGESLQNRMTKVKDVFEELLMTGKVEHIELYVDDGTCTEYQKFVWGLDSFVDGMETIYQLEGRTPCLHIVLKASASN